MTTYYMLRNKSADEKKVHSKRVILKLFKCGIKNNKNCSCINKSHLIFQKYRSKWFPPMVYSQYGHQFIDEKTITYVKFSTLAKWEHLTLNTKTRSTSRKYCAAEIPCRGGCNEKNSRVIARFINDLRNSLSQRFLGISNYCNSTTTMKWSK